MLAKKITLRMALALVVFSGFSCEREEAEKEETGKFIAEVLELSCGGIVVQFIDAQVGEDWRSYTNGETYQNVALTGYSSDFEVSEGQVMLLDFKKVQFLDGFYCDIGGLPSTKVEVWNVSVVD